MARPANRALLSELARDRLPLTHETLDQFRPSRPLAHLRAVLVAAGGLPSRDERMVTLQHWLADVIAQRDDPREREILRQYARWYLLRRLRGRLAAANRPGGKDQATVRHATDRETASVRNRVLAAIRVLDLAADKQLTLASITQADLDSWAADGELTYGNSSSTFIRWAVAGKHARPALKPHYSTGRKQPQLYDADRRWQDARRLLHDETLPLPDRIAGLLILLYGQNPADIEGLTTAAVDDDGTTIRLALATVPIVLPEPLAGLMRQHLCTRCGHATIGQPADVPWLFPGGRPGHPLGADRISDRLRIFGLHPRADRAIALFTMAAELPAAILARTLGITIRTAVSWQKAASGDWMTYAADVSRRNPRQSASQQPQDRHHDLGDCARSCRVQSRRFPRGGSRDRSVEVSTRAPARAPAPAMRKVARGPVSATSGPAMT